MGDGASWVRWEVATVSQMVRTKKTPSGITLKKFRSLPLSLPYGVGKKLSRQAHYLTMDSGGNSY